jgi:uncharacterized protein (DUF2126 family)
LFNLKTIWARHEERSLVILSERRITQQKSFLDEPEGQRLFELSTALAAVYVDGYTAQPLPCIKFK